MTEELIGNSKPLGSKDSTKLLDKIEKELKQGITPSSELSRVCYITLRTIAEEATKNNFHDVATRAIELLELYDGAFDKSILTSAGGGVKTNGELPYAEFLEHFTTVWNKAPFETVVEKVAEERKSKFLHALRTARNIEVAKFLSYKIITADNRIVTGMTEEEHDKLCRIIVLNESLKNKVAGIPKFDCEVVTSWEDMVGEPSVFNDVTKAETLQKDNHIIRNILATTYLHLSSTPDKILKTLAVCDDMHDIDFGVIPEDNDNVEKAIASLSEQTNNILELLTEKLK